ncbi:hypothetical protein VTL71DRAFT_10705 [Oculimacula yallundae]|uniref:Uncharacterized protein n=1 Tax=Oculimacula yallundae TaxID=86028 RepID=A0ABR4CW33_9HELO
MLSCKVSDFADLPRKRSPKSGHLNFIHRVSPNKLCSGFNSVIHSSMYEISKIARLLLPGQTPEQYPPLYFEEAQTTQNTS